MSAILPLSVQYHEISLDKLNEFNKANKEELKCSICQDEFGDVVKPGDDKIIVHDKKNLHPVHWNCMTTWVKKKTQCPECRAAADFSSTLSPKQLQEWRISVLKTFFKDKKLIFKIPMLIVAEIIVVAVGGTFGLISAGAFCGLGVPYVCLSTRIHAIRTAPLRLQSISIITLGVAFVTMFKNHIVMGISLFFQANGVLIFLNGKPHQINISDLKRKVVFLLPPLILEVVLQVSKVAFSLFIIGFSSTVSLGADAYAAFHPGEAQPIADYTKSLIPY